MTPTVYDPLLCNMELPAEVDDVNGVPVAGVIGLETFRCSVIEVDYVTSRVALFDPKTYEQERGKTNWQKLYVNNGYSVDAEFEGQKGVFNLTSIPTIKLAMYSPVVKS